MRRGGSPTAKNDELPSEKDLEDGMEGIKPPTASRMFKVARKEWPWLAVALIFLVGSLAAPMTLPLVFGRMMDIVVEGGDSNDKIERLNRETLLLLFVVLFSAVCSMVRSFTFNVAGERVVARLRIQLFRSILSQEVGMFDTRKTGELLSRLSSDTESLQNIATTNVSMFFRAFVMLVISAVLMFYTSWRLSLVIITVVPVVIVSISIYGRVVRRVAVDYSDAMGRSAEVAQETISNIRTVRSFAAEEAEIARYTRAVGSPDAPEDVCWFPPRGTRSTYAYGVKKQLFSATFVSFVTTVGLGACVLVIWIGTRYIVEGYVSVGELVGFMLYAVQIGAGVGMISGLVGQLFVAMGASRRAFQLIDRPPQIPISGGDYPDTPVKGNITFKCVNFSYPSRPDVKVLTDFSIDVPVNATYAFVGSSGAGKSTVFALLERFYEASSGSVLIDGHDVRTFDPRYLRRAMSLVAQEPVLFGSSIEANIAYGYASSHGDVDAIPPREQIEAVAKASFAHEFIDRFPKGYCTLIGERGVRLSGGQKQRIAIARALIVNPRILLLDEATSALDAESEHLVQQAINAVMVDRTTLIVAHRLSTVRHADSIAVVNGGRVEALGPHEDLYDRSQAYRDLVKRQLQQTDNDDSHHGGHTATSVEAIEAS